MYNLFRLTGDGLHCLALVVLFWKMQATGSCRGAPRLPRNRAPAHPTLTLPAARARSPPPRARYTPYSRAPGRVRAGSVRAEGASR